jgi:hypothetical protein
MQDLGVNSNVQMCAFIKSITIDKLDGVDYSNDKV